MYGDIYKMGMNETDLKCHNCGSDELCIAVRAWAQFAIRKFSDGSVTIAYPYFVQDGPVDRDYACVKCGICETEFGFNDYNIQENQVRFGW